MVSILNDLLGTILANAAVVPAGTNGSIDVFVTNTTQVVIDINGYYAPQISLANGAAAAPSLTFEGDSTSGLYSSGVGTVSVATGGTNRLTVASNGYVGIGTTTPGSTLDVVGDINLSGNLRSQGSPVLQGSISGANIGIGFGALANNTTGFNNAAGGSGALQNNTTGIYNTAFGAAALEFNIGAGGNTAFGAGALGFNTIGYRNTATGQGALGQNTSGAQNTAIGEGALSSNTTGISNTALGDGALLFNPTGSYNIAIGDSASSNVLGGSYNIHIANGGLASDNATIRIGSLGTQTSFFAAGIRGVTTGSNNAVPVMIDGNGQLGTVSSSRRFKEDIQEMGEASSGLLRLRPVTFRYKKPFADGSKPIQYGLIAEEVAEVYPDLVARSADGQIETVKYQVLDSMLLNEVQRQQVEIRGLEQQNQDLQRRLARLEAALVSASGEPRLPQ
jgi:hypothetical protein